MWNNVTRAIVCANISIACGILSSTTILHPNYVGEAS
ncbi:Protein STICHEL-like 3 [Zea mays]|uniref:Protein STICHEL-like 3 n=1 Tax=Zea mays TaxID=4577 RepID=A0A1D6MAB0_MAIZE|nr:Protein STICHEL-like 3 [Zea mays]